MSLSTIFSDMLGRVARTMEDTPWLWRLASSSHRVLRHRLDGTFIKVPRHTPTGLREWRSLLGSAAKSNSEHGATPHILIVSPRGWATHLLLDTLLAQALRVRGARITIWTCGARMPVCHIRNSKEAPPMPCEDCINLQNDLLASSDFQRVTTGEYASQTQRDQIRSDLSSLNREGLLALERDGVSLGEMGRDGIYWFYRIAHIPDTDQGTEMMRNFILLAETTRQAAKSILADLKPDLILMLNGLLTEERVIRSLGSQLGIPYITYERAFGFNHFVFSRNKLANYWNVDEHWETRRDLALSNSEEGELDEFLMRWRGGDGAVVQYWQNPEERDEVIRERLGITPRTRIFTLFTNIVWDTAAFNRDMAFESMWDWISQTVLYIQRMPETHLVIRIHPAECRLQGRETQDRILDRLNEAFPQLPANVSVIAPNNEISSYRLMDFSDLILVYTSTVGLEAAIAGKRVVVSGNTHYRNKGFTLDPETPDQYFEVLNQACTVELDDVADTRPLARRYAHLFFLKYMYPFPLFHERRRGNPHLNIDSLEALKPGNIPELDRLCQFILESVGQHEPLALVNTD